MRNTLILGLCAAAAVALAPQASAQWSDDFDSYPDGTVLHGVNGWEGWSGTPADAGIVTNVRSFSGPNSMVVRGQIDAVSKYSGVTSGTWTYSVMQYIPGNTTGTTYFIMLNTYSTGGPYNWSVQVAFNTSTNTITNEGGSGGTTSILYDQWVPIDLVIDLDNDTQDFFYNNNLLYSSTWTGEVSGGGASEIAATDHWSNGASDVFYDSASLTPAPGALALLGVAGLAARRRRRN